MTAAAGEGWRITAGAGKDLKKYSLSCENRCIRRRAGAVEGLIKLATEERKIFTAYK